MSDKKCECNCKTDKCCKEGACACCARECCCG